MFIFIYIYIYLCINIHICIYVFMYLYVNVYTYFSRRWHELSCDTEVLDEDGGDAESDNKSIRNANSNKQINDIGGLKQVNKVQSDTDINKHMNIAKKHAGGVDKRTTDVPLIKKRTVDRWVLIICIYIYNTYLLLQTAKIFHVLIVMPSIG
jgi:hypothetical protein